MAAELSRLTSKPLTDKNYQSRAKSATLALSGRGKLGHITSSSQHPQATAPTKPADEEIRKIEEWQMSDHQVMTLLLNSIEPKLAKMFLFAKTAKELWDRLKLRYGQADNFCHIFHLKQKIYHAKQDKSHTDYCVELTAMFNELEEHEPPTTNPEEIRQRIENEKTFIYLAGLDPSYEQIWSQILLASRLSDLETAISIVQREDTRRTTMNGISGTLTKSTEAMAFSTSTGGQGRPLTRDRCTHCGKAGHPVERCWVKHPHLKPRS